MSLESLKTKVEQLIEKAQSGGGEFVGIKWLEVDKGGFPTKAEVSGAPTFSILFYNGTMYGCYKNLEEVIIPSSTTEIGVNAFDRCTNLKKISDISNVIKFSTSCFDRCALLEIDELPQKLVYIGQYAMRGCVKNQFDEMPATVESIGAAAFNDGWKNSKLIFKGTPQTIANNAFMNNANITDIYCPWAEGAVANAPWGATSAQIHYNYNAEV